MSTRSKTFLPAWALLSLATNGLLMLTVILLLNRDRWLSARLQASDATSVEPIPEDVSTSLLTKTLPSTPALGPRHQLNYAQWVTLLRQEAEVAATKNPKHLTVLAGDSLSLWFPSELLPTERTWLNQGISGDTSGGLLNRLDVLDETQPETILVMIGINDLIRGVGDRRILANQRQIIRYLRRVHPQAQIVVQSILPHGGKKSTWVGRDRLIAIPSSRIRELNRQLGAIARSESVSYLDLYPLFADSNGNIQPELTTDGLHLSPQGYVIWRYALQFFMQVEREPSKAN
ncbi:SGNH/GDSL hydrolase family protein [Coleofasciculus sp. FACHB-712]|uniref:SGNH/GDSL hydrolase family protein n=1 Tax=Coleofasciculus sp. FACHB-712 TaxID=2692789 RepID=UPI0032201F4C